MRKTKDLIHEALIDDKIITYLNNMDGTIFNQDIDMLRITLCLNIFKRCLKSKSKKMIAISCELSESCNSPFDFISILYALGDISNEFEVIIDDMGINSITIKDVKVIEGKHPINTNIDVIKYMIRKNEERDSWCLTIESKEAIC